MLIVVGSGGNLSTVRTSTHNILKGEKEKENQMEIISGYTLFQRNIDLAAKSAVASFDKQTSYVNQNRTVSRGYFERSYNFERCSMCPYNRE